MEREIGVLKKSQADDCQANGSELICRGLRLRLMANLGEETKVWLRVARLQKECTHQTVHVEPVDGSWQLEGIKRHNHKKPAEYW